MIRHSLKIIINQWRKNVWLVAELFLVLSILWYVADYFTVLYLTSRTPVGFEIDNTYILKLSVNSPEHPNYIEYETGSDEPAHNFLRLADRIRQHPDVEAVSVGRYHYPYSTASMNTGYTVDSITCFPLILTVTADYFDVFRVKPSAGIDPSQLADALNEGNLITQTAADILFPGQSAVGQTVYDIDSSIVRISGVVNPIKRSPFDRPKTYALTLFKEGDLYGKNDKDIGNMFSICFRARPVANAIEYAESLKREIGKQLSAGNYFMADIVPVSKLKHDYLKVYGVYEGIQYHAAFMIFFLANIFLGVLGAFWLRVKKRIPETGLRMAIGAPRRAIITQMMTESFVLTLIAIVPASIVWVNVMAADLMPTEQIDFTALRFAIDTLLSAGAVIVAGAAATYYPARRSALVQPAEALQYE